MNRIPPMFALALVPLLASCLGGDDSASPTAVADTVFVADTLVIRDTVRVGNGAPGALPKYVFLFIGDGMGHSQVSLTEAYQASVLGDEIGFAYLTFSRFPVLGTVYTHAGLFRTTESAGAASAMASGVKAAEEVLGMDVARNRVSYFTEEAKAMGKAVGLVSTSPLDHATPAGFYAHRENRKDYYNIGRDLIASGFDFFAGGRFSDVDGLNPHDFVENPVNLEVLAAQAGYTIAKGKAALAAAASTPVIAMNTATRTNSTLPYLMDMPFQDSDQPTLMDYTAAAIRLLPKENGFFLLVESAKLDAAGHANDARGIISETQALDSAVQVALAFAAQHPDETLILVTADHETGGLALSSTRAGHRGRIGTLQLQTVSNDLLGDSLTQLMESHAGQTFEVFQAAYYAMISRLMGLGSENGTPIGVADAELLDEALHLVFPEKIALSATQRDFYGTNDVLLLATLRTMGLRGGVSWTSIGHTPTSVPLYAVGAGQERFGGLLDNTDFAWILREIWLGQEPAAGR